MRLARALGLLGALVLGVGAPPLTADAQQAGKVYRIGCCLWRGVGFRERALCRSLERGRPDEPQAEPCFRRAIEVARTQEAKSFELPAATSLSRLWQRQGRRADARRLLGEVYGWFTEGFDTADLKDAKALLDELA